jgi:hypothetical protein
LIDNVSASIYQAYNPKTKKGLSISEAILFVPLTKNWFYSLKLKEESKKDWLSQEFENS